MGIYLVRHGQTEANLKKIYSGNKTDTPLTLKGRKQAQRAASYFKNKRVTKIYSSSLGRALETAKAISNITGIEIIIDEKLSEIDFGIYEGLTWKESLQKYPKETDEWTKKGLSYKFPNGESFKDLLERIKEFFWDKNDEDIIVICHEGVIRAAIICICKIDINSVWDYEVKNGSIIYVETNKNIVVNLL